MIPAAWILCASVLGVTAANAAPTAPLGPLAPGDALALKVDRVLTGNGDSVSGGWVVVRDGRIESLDAKSAPGDAQVLEFPGATLCPGFIDPVTSLGANGDLEEPARAFTPDAKAADSFHPFHDAFGKAARGGLTTVGLSPGSGNLVGGVLAVIHTASAADRAVLGGTGPLRLSLTSAAQRSDREPTSRMGAMYHMRQFVAGGVPGQGALLVDVQSSDEVRLALDLLKGTGRPLVFLRPSDATECVDLLKGTGATVVLGPYSTTNSSRALRTAALLESHGIAVAFTGGGSASSLRLTAALAVREGMTPAGALKAVTGTPAAILGLDKKAGVLAAGQRADLVVVGGDPLDLSSKVEAVLVGGVLVDLEDDG